MCFIRVTDVDFGSVHFEKINEFRYLIGPAGNYYYLVQSIDKNIEDPVIDVEVEYEKMLENWIEIECHSFKISFF